MTVGEWLQSHSWVDPSLKLIIKKYINNKNKESKMDNFSEPLSF